MILPSWQVMQVMTPPKLPAPKLAAPKLAAPAHRARFACNSLRLRLPVHLARLSFAPSRRRAQYR